MRRWGATQMWPVREHQNINTRLYHSIYIALYLNWTTTIGRKRTSNNIDLVKPDQYIVPKHKKAKIPPPEPWPLPEFDPFPINAPYTNGVPNLPPYVNPTDSLTLFRLIWTDDLLKELATHTNEYTKLHPYREYKDKSKKVTRPQK